MLSGNVTFSRRHVSPPTSMEPISTSALACGSTLLVMQAPAQTPTPASLTVATVLDRMKQHLGVPWRTPTVDRLIVSTDNAQVQGIATT